MRGWSSIQRRRKWIWKVMQRNVWKDIANLRIRLLSNFTKSRRHAWMIINSEKKNMDMEGHAKKCVERYCELANKTTEQFYKVATPCVDDHQFREEENGSVGWYLARIGRPDILWSVNKLARAVKKWTKSCDNRLARLISYTHHTREFRQYCYVGNTAQQCRIGLFQDSDFAGDLESSRSTSGGVLCIFGSRTFVPISWMCKKQTSVSHSSTEAEIVSLDAGLRMDGISALDLWDSVIEVFHSSPNQTNKTKDVREPRGELVGNSSIKHAKTNSNHKHQSESDQHWSRSIKRNTFWFQSYVVCLWG